MQRLIAGHHRRSHRRVHGVHVRVVVYHQIVVRQRRLVAQLERRRRAVGIVDRHDRFRLVKAVFGQILAVLAGGRLSRQRGAARYQRAGHVLIELEVALALQRIAIVAVIEYSIGIALVGHGDAFYLIGSARDQLRRVVGGLGGLHLLLDGLELIRSPVARAAQPDYAHHRYQPYQRRMVTLARAGQRGRALEHGAPFGALALLALVLGHYRCLLLRQMMKPASSITTGITIMTVTVSIW